MYSASATYQDVVESVSSKIQNLMQIYETNLNSFADNINNIQPNDVMNLTTENQVSDLALKCTVLSLDLKSTLSSKDYEDKSFYKIFKRSGDLKFDFQNKTGYKNKIDEKHSCIFSTEFCSVKYSDCPDPYSQNHQRIFKAFSRNAQSLRQHQTDDLRLIQGIKSVHFTSEAGVTLINPAQKLKNSDLRILLNLMPPSDAPSDADESGREISHLSEKSQSGWWEPPLLPRDSTTMEMMGGLII